VGRTPNGKKIGAESAGVAVDERGWAPSKALAAVHAKGRDNARTPMPWKAGPGAGFTTGRPWLALNPNHDEVNAEAARADPDSVFHFYRQLIALRRSEPLLTHGCYRLILEDHPQVYAYLRETSVDESGGEAGSAAGGSASDAPALLVLANFSDAPAQVELPTELGSRAAALLLSNLGAAAPDAPASAMAASFTLAPWEGRWLKLR